MKHRFLAALLLPAVLLLGGCGPQAAAPTWADLVQVDWTEHSEKLDTGITMTYLTCGPEDGAPVLLIHGATDSRISWSQVAPTLAETYGYRCYIPELRGHGKTDKPQAGDEGYTVAQHSQDILSLMDKLGLDSALVAGHSLGSLITQELAITAPERVEKMALIASGAQTTENAALAEVFGGNGVDYFGVRGYDKEGKLPDDYVAAWASCTNEDANFVKALYEHARALPYDAWYNIFAGCNAVDNRARLGTVTCPVDLIWGTEDSIFLEEDQQQLQEALTAAPVNFFPIQGASHNTHWDNEATMKTVAAELDRFFQS